MGNRAAARFLRDVRRGFSRDGAERALARVEALHQPKTITHIERCRWHSTEPSPHISVLRGCSECTKTPVLVCSHCSCPNDAWPCRTRRAIDGEG